MLGLPDSVIDTRLESLHGIPQRNRDIIFSRSWLNWLNHHLPICVLHVFMTLCKLFDDP